MTEHEHRNWTEATYIKVSERKQAEKKRNKKVQRVVSSIVVGLCLLFVAIGGIDLVSATSNAYEISVDGEPVAVMVSETDAQSAIDQCLANETQRYLDEYNYSVSYTNNVDIKSIPAISVAYSSVADAATLLSGHLDLVAEAVVLYVDEQPALYVATEEAAIEAVNLAKTHYASTDDEGVSRVYTTERVSMSEDTVDCADVLSVDDAANMLIYGQLESTADPKPLISVNVERERKEVTDLPYETIRVDDSSLLRGSEEVVTAGQNGTQRVTLRVTEVNGNVVSSEQLDSEVITAAVDEVVNVGTMLITSSRGENGSGEFGWPLASGTGLITSRFGWRSRGWHSGVDLADAYDSIIYAVADGTVTFVGSQSGYGSVIFIDHGNGVETRYAHNNQMFVSEGDYVERGTAIASIGMTGTTTGPHVHFEIRVDGEAVDPLPYIE